MHLDNKVDWSANEALYRRRHEEAVFPEEMGPSTSLDVLSVCDSQSSALLYAVVCWGGNLRGML